MNRALNASKFWYAMAGSAFLTVFFTLILYSPSMPQEFKMQVAKWYMGIMGGIWGINIAATGFEDASLKWWQQPSSQPSVQVGDTVINQQAAPVTPKPLIAPAPPPPVWRLPK